MADAVRARFDKFVLFAEMRTGSNYLEDNLNQMPGLTCHGELFNPHFVGQHNRDEKFGVSLRDRDADPDALLTAMQSQTDGLPGFRYFHDHDARVLDSCLPDPRCAKVVLTRNPVDSYVSLRIARQTNQWRLTNVTHRKAARIRFDPEEFEQFLARMQAFQLRLQRGLQISGQTAFHIHYDDINDVEVLNGLGRFLGADVAPLERASNRLKRQNPAPLEDKVENYDEMIAALARMDGFGLSRIPNAEPRRGPVVPSYVAAPHAPLLFLPIKGGLVEEINAWLAAYDDAAPEDVLCDFNQKSLRQWKRQNKGHRSFAVLRHPMSRAHEVFCQHILNTGPGAYLEIRETLRRVHDLPLPDGAPGEDWTPAQHRAAFAAFLHFLKANLAGQTAIRVDPAWATQAAVLEGMSTFAQPDMLLREDRLATGLAQLVQQIGGTRMPPAPEPQEKGPFPLSEIHDGELEKLCREVYSRDYMQFGFRVWTRRDK
ncbi:MAG: nodulation protein NodH [Celeribacter sp.]|jgi:LPS sulfotransferase NodH